MKKLLLWILLCVPMVAEAQNQLALIQNVRRLVGEPDSTTGVSNADIRQWLGEFFRENALYGLNERRTRIVGAANRDSFALPSDFLFLNSITKTEKKTAKKFPLDIKSYSYQRVDTLIRSIARPDTVLADDVLEVLQAYRKAPDTKEVKPLIRVGYDSLQKLSINPLDYYIFVPQPKPMIIFGKHSTTVDTVYLIVSVIVPSYSIVDSTAAAGTTGSRAFLLLSPPLVRADTLIVWYSPRLDTMATGNSTTTPLGELDEPVRVACEFYCAAKFYDKVSRDDKRDYYDKRYVEILSAYAIKKGRMKSAPVVANPNQ